jgi:hypothetical protein
MCRKSALQKERRIRRETMLYLEIVLSPSPAEEV